MDHLGQARRCDGGIPPGMMDAATVRCMAFCLQARQLCSVTGYYLPCMQAASLDRFAGDLAIILALDWLLDRCRTAINLLGDAYGVVLIDHLTRHHSGPPVTASRRPPSQLELV